MDQPPAAGGGGHDVPGPDHVHLVGDVPRRAWGHQCRQVHHGVVAIGGAKHRRCVTDVTLYVGGSGVGGGSLVAGDVIAPARPGDGPRRHPGDSSPR